jgi:hypothetical protein
MGAYAQALAHKQALSDDELRGKATQYADQLTSLQQKYALAPEGSQSRADIQNQMQTVLHDTRMLYHPDQNPGAIAKFGHILTDALHITNPQQRIQAEAAKRATAMAGDERQAQEYAAAAPVSPQEIAQQQTQSEIAQKEAAANWALDWAKRNNIAGEALDELKQHLAGVPIATQNWVPTTGKFANGQQVTLLRNSRDGRTTYMDGRPVEPNLLSGFVAVSATKPSTSKFGMNVASYKYMHGIPETQPLTLQETAFVEQQSAINSAAPSSTITNTMKQDFRGFWVPIQETNRRVPGIGVILHDPLGESGASGPAEGAGSASPRGAAGEAKPAVPKTPAEARKAAREKTGGTQRAGNERAGNERAGGGPNVRVGGELFAAPSKEYNDTRAAYDAAQDRVETMDKNLKDALNGDQQAMLSLVANHIGMTLGAQKGARINQAVWNEAVESAPWLERAKARFSPTTGYLSGVTLTPDQMKQMDHLAHEKADVLKHDLDRLQQQFSSPQGAGEAGGAADQSLADRLSQALEGK